MDQELTALAITAASTITKLAVTEFWGQVKSRLLVLTGRPVGEVGELERAAADLRSKVGASSQSANSQEHEELERQILILLLSTLRREPRLAQELKGLLSEFAVWDSKGVSMTGDISISGKATSGGRIYQQGQGIQNNS